LEAVGAEDAVSPAHSSDVYAASADGPLFCCEILSNVSQRRQSLRSLREAEPEIEIIVHPLCIVASQDCDLENDFVARQNGQNPPLPNVLLLQVVLADELKGNVPRGSDIWKRIIQNKDDRYQFLRAVANVRDASNQGLSELGIDFRRYFTIPTDELYEQLNLDARRRCRLVSPYKEHFMVRLTHFMARVGLPIDHHVADQ
jgi:hypothetical protein